MKIQDIIPSRYFNCSNDQNWLRISGCTPRIHLMLSALRGNITHTKRITLFGNQPTIFIVCDIDRLSLPCSGRCICVNRHIMLISWGCRYFTY